MRVRDLLEAVGPDSEVFISNDDGSLTEVVGFDYQPDSRTYVAIIPARPDTPGEKLLRSDLH